MDTLPKTRSERFISAQQPQWAELRSIIRACQRRPLRLIARGDRRGPTSSELRRLPRLYRALCTDLAEARMRKLSPEILEYLNSLVSCAHAELHGFARVSPGAFHRLLTAYIPAVLADSRGYMLTAAALFLIPLAATTLIVVDDPSLSYRILDQTVLDLIESMHSASVSLQPRVETVAAGTAFYIQHNVSIAFLCFATGILLGLGPIYLLIYNGLFLGSVLGHLVSVGYGANLVRFVAAHAVLELGGVIVAGAAGLRLGMAVVSAIGSSHASLRRERGPILALLTPGVAMIVSAALIEAWISPSAVGMPLRLAIAAASVALLVVAAVAVGLHRRHAERRSP